MGFNFDSHTKAVVIVHGKSEQAIIKHIKSKLKIPIEIYAKDNGNTSIEISSINNILNNHDFKSKKNFLNKYKKIKTNTKKDLVNFRLFIVLDVDYTSNEDLHKYEEKSLFKNHWLYDYIDPIVNDNNLEEVLNDIGYTHAKNDKQKKEYKNLFPVERGKQDIDRVKEFRDDLCQSKKSNLADLLSYCLKSCPDFDQ